MGSIKKLFRSKKATKILTITSIILICSITVFFIVSLFVFYNKTYKPKMEVPLYHEFKANTVEYAFDDNDSIYADISEQFLSYNISYGVDVSEWQGEIDWQKVRETGISFAIIRCGFRQIVGSKIMEDSCFRKNIEGATKAGLKVGVYFYGTAKNEKEALEEAMFTIDLIKDYKLSYPVVYDVETFDRGRLKGVSYSTITDNVLTFTETVGTYGYETMVYSYHNALTYMLETGRFDGKLIWLAHYTDQTNYKGNYNMWQYTSSGKVDGIKTNVDLNVSYFTYVDNEDAIIANPNYVAAPNIDFTKVEENVKTIRKTTMRSSPSTTIPNQTGTIPKGKKFLRVGISDEYSIIEYNGQRAYVRNSDLAVIK